MKVIFEYTLAESCQWENSKHKRMYGRIAQRSQIPWHLPLAYGPLLNLKMKSQKRMVSSMSCEIVIVSIQNAVSNPTTHQKMTQVNHKENHFAAACFANLTFVFLINEFSSQI